MTSPWLLLLSVAVTQPALAGELKAAKERSRLSCGDLEVLEQSWKLDKTRGIAWKIRLPRSTARLHVSGGDTWSERLPSNDGWVAAGHRGSGLVVSGGEAIRELAPKGARAVLQQGHFGPVVIYRDQWEGKSRDAVQTAPWLVDDGQIDIKPLPIDSSAARVAVVIGLSYVWVVAVADKQDIEQGDDGLRLKNPQLRGMPMEVFARYLRDHTDAVQAVELAAGTSVRVEAKGCGERFSLGTANDPPFTARLSAP